MHLRATWKGSLNVSLVSLRVQAYTTAASQPEGVQLHQLHHSCQGRGRGGGTGGFLRKFLPFLPLGA